MTIKLYFLQASRCIRTAWQLEELGLDYEVDFSARVNRVAPPEFKKRAGDLGKFPTLVDNDVSYFESGNIAEYLEDKYDTDNKLLAKPGVLERYAVLRWVHAAEGTFMLHALPAIYVKWFGEGHAQAQEQIIKGLTKNIQADMDFLDNELGKSKGKFLLGEKLTIADITMHFNISFALARGLGSEGKTWPNIEKWVENCEATEGFKKAVEKTGYDLSKSG